jgi:hypothetical protein
MDPSFSPDPTDLTLVKFGGQVFREGRVLEETVRA